MPPNRPNPLERALLDAVMAADPDKLPKAVAEARTAIEAESAQRKVDTLTSAIAAVERALGPDNAAELAAQLDALKAKAGQ